MLAVFAAARARMAAATASARKFGLPLLSSTRASNTTSSALAAISSGTSIVFDERQISERIKLDQLLSPRAQRLGALMGVFGAVPATLRTQRDLLKQCGRRRYDRRRGRPARRRRSA